MNIILRNAERVLVSLTSGEIEIILRSLGAAIDIEPRADLGEEERCLMNSLVESLREKVTAETAAYETAVVWADAYSVMVRAITVFGDPVEMSTSEAEAFISAIEKAKVEAS